METNTGGLTKKERKKKNKKNVPLLFKEAENRRMSRTVKKVQRGTSGYRIFEDGASSCMLVKCVASPEAA